MSVYAAIIHTFPDRAGRRQKSRRAGDSGPSNQPPVSNVRLAMAVLLVAESMFFAGLISAYLVLRGGALQWPPAHLPLLPLQVTWVNTFVLVASGVTMLQAVHAARRNAESTSRWLLSVTALLGVCFLCIQGSEWLGLMQHGLTLSAGAYGATFYALVGAHALHVLAAIVWLLLVAWWAWHRSVLGRRYMVIEACATYWVFVCVLWVALFALVYQ